MKRTVLWIFVIFVGVSALFAGPLRNYRFSSDMNPTANPPYIGDPLFKEILFEGFRGENALLNSVPLYEVEQNFNTEFQKQLIKYGVKVYDFSLVSAYRDSLTTRAQQGTLNIDSVQQDDAAEYRVNPIESVTAVLCGEIEYFKFNQSFDQSFICLTLRIYNRDTGYYYWITTLTGKVRDVIDYVSDAITHAPVDNSISLRREALQNTVQQEITSRLPQIAFSIDPAEALIKDPNRLPNVKFKIQVTSRYLITQWDVKVYDSETNVVKSFEGTGQPESITWDLLGQNGNPVPSDATYTVIVTVIDEMNNKVSQPLDMKITTVTE